MYCQHCGETIENPAGRQCQECGREITRQTRGFVWPALFLLAILALVVVAVYSYREPADDTNVAQIDSAVRSGGVKSQVTLSNDDVTETESPEPTIAPAAGKITLPDSYELPVSYGDLGLRLQAAGAIDYDRFVRVYERAGQPLTETQLAILSHGSDSPIVFNRENAYFLLNFLWALGLTNQNSILDQGPLVEYGEGDIGRFASTGGWTIGQRPSTELYSSTSLISLTPEQQTRLENVAYNVYRPCCNNHTAFADCNHGLAMLGLLELMAGQGASEDEMFEAAKYVNSFWYPQQSLETAAFFRATMGLDYADVDGRMAVGKEVFSGSGFRTVHEWLVSNGQLEQAPKSGGGCGV
jgi:hypothetical protein